MKFNILIVEDDGIVANYLKKIIEEDNSFQVIAIAKDYKEAYNLLIEKKVNIIFIETILDNRPIGTKLAIDISKKYPEIIIIFATAYSEKEILENAAKAKAFAYLLKPYRPDEIKAVLTLTKERLKQFYQKNTKLCLIDGYCYDFKNEKLYKNKQEIHLSKEELKFIKLLAQNHSIILDKETILNHLNISNDALRALVYRIRNTTTKELIQSHKRFGYKLATI